MKTQKYSLAGRQIFLLTALRLLAGCATATRKLKPQTGAIYQVSGGFATNKFARTVAFFVLNTTRGDFAFSSFDTRKPQEIVTDFSRSLDGLVPEGGGSFTISILNCAELNWNVSHIERRLIFPSGKVFWMNSYLSQPPSDYTAAFTKAVRAPLVIEERTERTLEKGASGP
jgi:hypothetical protein